MEEKWEGWEGLIVWFVHHPLNDAVDKHRLLRDMEEIRIPGRYWQRRNVRRPADIPGLIIFMIYQCQSAYLCVCVCGYFSKYKGNIKYKNLSVWAHILAILHTFTYFWKFVRFVKHEKISWGHWKHVEREPWTIVHWHKRQGNKAARSPSLIIIFCPSVKAPGPQHTHIYIYQFGSLGSPSHVFFDAI